MKNHHRKLIIWIFFFFTKRGKGLHLPNFYLGICLKLNGMYYNKTISCAKERWTEEITWPPGSEVDLRRESQSLVLQLPMDESSVTPKKWISTHGKDQLKVLSVTKQNVPWLSWNVRRKWPYPLRRCPAQYENSVKPMRSVAERCWRGYRGELTWQHA